MQSLLFDSRMNDSCELILFSELKYTMQIVYFDTRINYFYDTIFFLFKHKTQSVYFDPCMND